MRVTQESTFLLDVVRHAERGQFGLAPFQRPYEWQRDDVEKLFVSILKEWPVGAFTIWHPLAEEREMFSSLGRIGPVEHSENVGALILDGQNRLASLVYASRLSDAPVSPARPYSDQEVDVWFGDEVLVADVVERRVRFEHCDTALSATTIPLGDIFDVQLFKNQRLLDVCGRAKSAGMAVDDHIGWLFDDIPDAVRTARVTVTNLMDATFEEARDCYLTICRAGRPISPADFDRAFAMERPCPPHIRTFAP